MKKNLLFGALFLLAVSWQASAQTTDPCTAPVEGTIGVITCDDIGTANYAANAQETNWTGFAGGDNNAVTNGCGTTSNGGWFQYDLASGLSNLNIDPLNSTGSGSGNMYAEFFQGPNCSSLTSISCNQIGQFNKGSFLGYQAVLNNLNDAQNLWVYVSSDKSSFNFNSYLVGSGQYAAPNEDCANASLQASTGCNLGAPPDNFSFGAMPGNSIGAPYNDPGYQYAAGPEYYYANGICGEPVADQYLNGSSGPDGTLNECGGSYGWSSNENTVFFEIQATNTNASVTIDNVVCNDGASGQAQFGLADDCQCLATQNYADCPCWYGCFSGTGTLSISLTPNQNYIIVVDGFAGDVCTWDFTYTGITTLSQDVITMDLIKKKYDAVINWTTDNLNATHFDVMKLKNGDDVSGDQFELVETVFAKDGEFAFSFTDKNIGLKEKRVLYKIVQHTKSGEEISSPIKTLNFNNPDDPITMYNHHTGEVEMSFYQREAGTYFYGIYDSMGKELASEEVNVEVGGSKIYRKLDSETPGVYFVVIRNIETQEGFTHKFIKN